MTSLAEGGGQSQLARRFGCSENLGRKGPRSHAHRQKLDQELPVDYRDGTQAGGEDMPLRGRVASAHGNESPGGNVFAPRQQQFVTCAYARCEFVEAELLGCKGPGVQGRWNICATEERSIEH